MMDIFHWLHGVLAIAGLVSVICRLKVMSKQTRGVVIHQHGLLFAGLLWSLFLPREHAALPVLAGVVGFLLLSADRWRYGPPDGTTKPAELDGPELHHVGGGRKDA